MRGRGNLTNATVAQPSGDSVSENQSTDGNEVAGIGKGPNGAPPGKQAPTPDEATGTITQTEQPDPYKLRDLIAQEDMAYWAMWMVIAALLTFLVTSIGTLLIWRQVRLTRQAVVETSEATVAMRKTNEIAELSAKAQLRAYITVEPEGVNVPLDGMLRVPLVVENVGETPAHKVMSFSRFGLDPNPINFDPSKLEPPESWLTGEINDATFGRGVKRFLYPYVREDFLEGHWDDIDAKKLALIHFGHVIYEDVFGDRHRTHFAFYHWGEELSDVTSLRCRYGNTAD